MKRRVRLSQVNRELPAGERRRYGQRNYSSEQQMRTICLSIMSDIFSRICRLASISAEYIEDIYLLSCKTQVLQEH